MKHTINYGIDAPPVIKRLSIVGLLSFLCGIALYLILLKHHPIIALAILIYAMCNVIVTLIPVIWMFYSSLLGKKHMRDLLIANLQLQGSEHVLDVGCGRGLLLIGAAKKLSLGGKAVGIDLWRQEDLSNNKAIHAIENAKLEGVFGRVEIVSGDMCKMHFDDNTFDAVVSSMAIHNVAEKSGRNDAIKEIVRVLKPGGQVSLLDFQCTAEYRQSLCALDLVNVTVSRRYCWMFPFVRIVTGKKPF